MPPSCSSGISSGAVPSVHNGSVISSLSSDFESKGAQGRVSNLGNVDYTGSGETFSKEFSLTQSLTVLGITGV